MEDEKMELVEDETTFDETIPVEEGDEGMIFDPMVGLGVFALAAVGTFGWLNRGKIRAYIDAKREAHIEKKVKKLGDKLLKIRKRNNQVEEAKAEEE